MGRKLRISRSFIIGLVVGFLPVIIIGVNQCRFYRAAGMPYVILGPKEFGNVKITAADNILEMNPTNEVMGVDGVLSIEKNGKVVVSMLFDENKCISSMSLNSDQEDSIVSIQIYDEKMMYLDYGSLTKGLNWEDWNCDGIFDLQFRDHGETCEILIDSDWVPIKKKAGLGKKGIVTRADGTEKSYTFDFGEGKWLPVEDAVSE